MEELMETLPDVPSKRPTDSETWADYRTQFQAVRDECLGWRHFISKMKGGILRTCYYIMDASDDGSQVLTKDSKGETVIAVYSRKHFGQLKKGDLVLIGGDPLTGMVIMGRCPVQSHTGELMVFERAFQDGKLEVSNNGTREVFFCTEDLHSQIKSETVKPGAMLICMRGVNIAFEAVPKQDGMDRFKFLLDEDAPDVLVERDIGSPPPCINETFEFFRMEMTKPQLRRKYGLRPLMTQLYEGPPGGGKTLSLKAVHRGMYDIIKELTGLNESEIGRRVLKMKASQMLSMWLGESDKAFERFFDETAEVARKPVKVGKKERTLPTFVIIEELDSMFRQRSGSSHDPVERIMTTALQRLDPINEELSRGIICIIGTTNEPGLVDRAFLRRIGGKTVRFGMLTMSSFPKVLEKHLSKLPVASTNGTSQHDLRAKMVEELTGLFFSKDNKPIVEITLHKRPDTVVKYRRDFFSGALVDRAVQEAAGMALKAEMDGNGDGIEVKQLGLAFQNQIKSTVDQLSEQNAHKYVDLPDGEHVEKVKRV